MKDYSKIKQALQTAGAEISDDFDTKMNNPEFAENVRKALQTAGAEVPDSNEFYKKYVSEQHETQPAESSNIFDTYAKYYDELFPRVGALADSDKPGVGKYFAAIPAAILDVASIPGREVAAGVAGLATGLGSLVGGTSVPEAIKSGASTGFDVFGRKGGDVNAPGISQFAESIIKDPLLAVPGIGELKFGAKVLPKIANPAVREGIWQAAQNLGYGLAENVASPERSIGQDLIAPTLAGGVIGAGATGVSNLLESLGRTTAGRALLKKFTPSELRAGLPERLSSQIKLGYGVDVTDGKGNIDPNKLAGFLDTQTRKMEGSRAERWPDYLQSESENIGKQLGEKYKAGSVSRFNKEGPNPEAQRINVEPIMDKLYSEMFPRAKAVDNVAQSIADRDAIRNYMEDIKNNLLPKRIYTQYSKLVNENIEKGMSKEAAENAAFESFIGTSGPKETEMFSPVVNELGDPIVIPETNLTPMQVKDLNRYLFNAAKENSPKYHPSTEDFAASLRAKLSDEQKKLLGEQGNLMPRYSALEQLRELSQKSNYFNPERPTTFFQGARETISKLPTQKIGTVASGVTKIGKAGVRAMSRTPEFETATPISDADLAHLEARVNQLNASDKRTGWQFISALRTSRTDAAAKKGLADLLGI